MGTRNKNCKKKKKEKFVNMGLIRLAVTQTDINA